MLTTKIRAPIFLIFLLVLTTFFGGFGCAPSGTRALLKGERLVEQGKYAEAVKYFEEATHAYPDNAKAWNHLGLGYQYAGDAKKSAQAYQQALKLDQNLTAARYNLGSLHLDQNNNAAATAELTTFIQLEPKSALGWHKLGVAQMRVASQFNGAERTRQLDAAKRSLDYAQSLEPSAETLNAIGLLQIQRGRAREAVPNFTAALQEQPDYAPALLNLAIVHHQYLGDKRQALANYQRFAAVAKQAPEIAEVQATIRQLQNELNPPVAAVAAPIAAPPPATPRVVAPVTVSPTKIETKPEPTVEKPPTPRPTPVIASPKAQPLPKPEPKPQPKPEPQPEPKIEVARLPDELPPVKAAAPDAPIAAAKQSAPVNRTSSVPVATPIPPREIEPRTKEPGGLAKLNPVTWFKKKPKETVTVTELPVIKPTLGSSTAGKAEETSVENAAPTVAQLKPVIPRFKYRLPAKPREGNRADAEPLFTRGVQAQKDRRLADALGLYRQALEKDPSYFEATYNLALAARAAGDLSSSLIAYEQALVIMPESVNARYNFAFTLQEAGYFQDSANELEKLLRQNPNETRAHLLLASLCAQRLDRVSSAREHYKKVLDAEPQHPQATQIRYWLAAHP